MSAKRELGRTVPEDVRVLPELTFDMFESQPIPAILGKTAMPVKVLPELEFNLTAEESSPPPPMVIPGRVHNGVVVPEGGPALPEGAAVSIHFTPQA